MPLDVYTREPIHSRSAEHVVPRFLGGKLTSDRLLDRSTNSEFGHGIDAALEAALRSVRVILGVCNTDGDSPKALEKIVGADGRVYRVAAGGHATAPPVVNTRWSDDRKELTIEASVPEESAVREMLGKLAKRGGKNLDDLVASLMVGAEHKVDAMPEMTFSLPLFEEGPYRATAKIACNLLAAGNPGTFLEPEFDLIRDYVLGKSTPTPFPVQFTAVDVTEDAIGPLDHLVRVDTDPTGSVALVVYFGLLGFVIRLGARRDGPPRSYRVDQLGGRDRLNHLDDLQIPVPSFEDASVKSYEAFIAEARQQVDALCTRTFPLQREAWLHRVIAPHWERLRQTCAHREPTEDEIREFSAAVADDVMRDLTPNIETAFERRLSQGRDVEP